MASIEKVYDNASTFENRRTRTTLCLEDQIDICYRFSRELEHSDLNLNAFEDLLAADKLFALENMLKIC